MMWITSNKYNSKVSIMIKMIIMLAFKAQIARPVKLNYFYIKQWLIK